MRAAPRHARPRERVPPWVGWAGVALLTGTSLYLGSYHLAGRSVWIDESYSWVVAAQKWSVMVTAARGQGWHLLPYYVLLHGVIGVFGDSPTALRAPSVLAGAAAVPFLYLLAVRLGGRVAALCACLLFVVSEPLVFWQQNARDYAFVVLFGVVGTWGGVAATQTGRVWGFAVWALTMGLGCYTHPEVIFLVPVQLTVFLLWAPSNRTRVKLLGIVAVAALALLPALLYAKDSGVYKGTFLTSPNHDSATEIASFLASAASTVGPVTSVNHALLGVTFLVIVIGVAILGADLAERGCRPDNMGLSLGLAWAVLPMLFAWLVSETGRQAFIDRYLIVSLPGVALLIAQVADRLKPRALGLFVVAYLTLFHAGLLAQNYQYQLDDYRSAATMIVTSARQGDCLTFQANGGRIAFDYYAAQLGTGPHRKYFYPPQVLPRTTDASKLGALDYGSLSNDLIADLQNPSAVRATAKFCSRIFVLESHFGGPVGPPSSVHEYDLLQQLTGNLRLFYRTQTVKPFGGAVVVQVFQRVAIPR